jgi:hypothetical protein
MKKAMTALAALCLVLVVSSGAYAAKGLLTGADIKDGSLTGADVKAHTLGTGLLTASARNSLSGNAGARGARGAAGSAGPAGVAGVTGAPGVAGAPGATGASGPTGLTGAAGAAGITEGSVCALPGPLTGTIHWTSIGAGVWSLTCVGAH